MLGIVKCYQRKSRVGITRSCGTGEVVVFKRRGGGLKLSFKLRLEGDGGNGYADFGWKCDSRQQEQAMNML